VVLPSRREALADRANSPFNQDGTLTDAAIKNSTMIIAARLIGNPEIPQGYSKFTTETYQSSVGDFQVYFYYNIGTGNAFYGNDYKAVLNKGSIQSYK
jgi:hypothetical protein